MKAEEHYLKLREAWPWVREGEASNVTLDEVAAVLDCTRQNARLVLKQMGEAGWITWVAGRGRGNLSSLTFWQTAERVVLDLALSAAGRGDAHEAFERMARLGPARQSEVVGRLTEQLGFRQEYWEETSRPRDVLRTFLNGGYAELDPVRVYYAKEINMVTQIYDTLVRREVDGRIVPHLLHGWETDAEERIWKLYLRKGVTFHNGREMTAEDVVWTLTRLRGAESLYGRVYDGIEVVRVHKRYVVEVRLREPDALFLTMLAAPVASVVSVVSKESGGLPVGTGPFSVVRNDERQFVLEAHEAYFQGRPFLDRYETWIVPPEQVKSVDWSQLDVHLMRRDSPSESEGWREKSLEKAMVQYLTLRIENAALRRVICNALHGEDMVTELGGSRAVANYGLWRHEFQTENPEATRQYEATRPNRPLRLLTFGRAENREDAYWIQERCQRAGISLDLDFVGGREFLQPGRLEQADLILKGDMIDEHAEFCFYRALLGDRSVLPQHQHPWIEAALTEARREFNPEKRTSILSVLDRRLQDEGILQILYHERYTASYQPHIQGITSTGTGMIDLRKLWFQETD